MSAIVIRVMGTNRSMVRHHCGQRMQHLETYLLGGIDASDWWCNRCAEAEQMWGDEDDPKTPKTEAPNTVIDGATPHIQGIGGDAQGGAT